MLSKLKAYTESLKKVTVQAQIDGLLKIVRDNEERITAMNTDQLFSGKKSDGLNLPDYSRVSVEVYGKPAGPIRLYDEGDFYRGFFLRADKFPVIFSSRDHKTEMLQNDFGITIFGLTGENKRELLQVYLKGQVLTLYKKLLTTKNT